MKNPLQISWYAILLHTSSLSCLYHRSLSPCSALFAWLISHDWKYCWLIWWERKILFIGWKSTAYKPNKLKRTGRTQDWLRSCSMFWLYWFPYKQKKLDYKVIATRSEPHTMIHASCAMARKSRPCHGCAPARTSHVSSTERARRA